MRRTTSRHSTAASSCFALLQSTRTSPPSSLTRCPPLRTVPKPAPPPGRIDQQRDAPTSSTPAAAKEVTSRALTMASRAGPGRSSERPIVAPHDLAEDPRRPATSEGLALVLLMTRSATAFPSAEGSFDSNRRRSVSFGKTRARYSSNDRIVPSSPASVLRLSAISVASSDRSSC